MNRSCKNLKERISSILDEMEKLKTLSPRWIELEDKFYELIEFIGNPKLREFYLKKYLQIGTNDPKLVERYFKLFITPSREEFLHQHHYEVLYEETSREEQYADY